MLGEKIIYRTQVTERERERGGDRGRGKKGRRDRGRRREKEGGRKSQGVKMTSDFQEHLTSISMYTSGFITGQAHLSRKHRAISAIVVMYYFVQNLQEATDSSG